MGISLPDNSLTGSSGSKKPVGFSYRIQIGAHLLSSCNLSQVHDFIEICIHLISHRNADLKALSEQGYSINEVASHLGYSYSTARDHLVRQGVTLRENKSVSFSGNQRQTFKNSAPPPYGFCYLEGGLQKDPREYPILQTIEKQRQIGKTPSEIARYLNSKNFKTLHGKT